MTEEGKTPMKVRCGRCSHVWAPIYLPMDMGEAARILGACTCPKCGQDATDIYAQADGVILG